MCQPPSPPLRGAPARRPKIHSPSLSSSERVGSALPATVASGPIVVDLISVGDAPSDAVDVAVLERMIHCCTVLASAPARIIASNAGHRPGLVSPSARRCFDLIRPTLEISCLLYA